MNGSVRGEGLSIPTSLERSSVITRARRNGRVLVYGMNYAPEMAGVGRYTGEIAEHMAAQGYQVTVVTTPPHYPGWKIRDGHVNGYRSSLDAGVRVLRTPLVLHDRMGGIWRLIAPLSFALTSAPVVIWQILSTRPDTVFCVEPTLFAAPAAQLAAWVTRSRVVLHVQDLEVDAAFAVGHLPNAGWLKRLGYAFERFTLRRFHHIITISDRMASRLSAKGVAAGRIGIVRNWVDLSHIFPLDRVSPYRAELGYGPEHFVVVYSGNIGAKQGLEVLLEAARHLAGEPHVRFVVAGEGPLKSGLEQRYGSLENVRFLPFQPYERLNEFLNMADLHVLPQGKGTADLVLPSKLGGMLASGKPVVVTADKGTELADFLGDLAHVTPPGDSQSLASTILAVSHAPPPRSEGQSRLVRRLSKLDGLDALLSQAISAAEERSARTVP